MIRHLMILRVCLLPSIPELVEMSVAKHVIIHRQGTNVLVVFHGRPRYKIRCRKRDMGADVNLSETVKIMRLLDALQTFCVIDSWSPVV